MPRGVYDRSKSKTEGPKAPKAKTQGVKAAKAAPVTRKQVAKQTAKTASVAAPKATGRVDGFAALTASIAALSPLTGIQGNLGTAAQAEVSAQIEALKNLRMSAFGRSTQEQADYDAEIAKVRAEREAAKAAAAAESDDGFEDPEPAQAVAQNPNNGTVPLPAKPIMPVPPSPTA